MTPNPSGRSKLGRHGISPWAALAAEAIKAGLVDECHLIVVPVMVGSGKKSLPGDVRLQLQLLDERRFSSGVVHLSYRIVT